MDTTNIKIVLVAIIVVCVATVFVQRGNYEVVLGAIALAGVIAIFARKDRLIMEGE